MVSLSRGLSTESSTVYPGIHVQASWRGHSTLVQLSLSCAAKEQRQSCQGQVWATIRAVAVVRVLPKPVDLNVYPLSREALFLLALLTSFSFRLPTNLFRGCLTSMTTTWRWTDRLPPSTSAPTTRTRRGRGARRICQSKLRTRCHGIWPRRNDPRTGVDLEIRVEKYRPNTMEDVSGHQDILATINKFVDSNVRKPGFSVVSQPFDQILEVTASPPIWASRHRQDVHGPCSSPPHLRIQEYATNGPRTERLG